MSSHDARTIETLSHRTRQQRQDCARWLAFCVSIGWEKSKLDALERIWWEYHDDKKETPR